MIYKASVNWIKVTEQIPEDGRDYLVWDGRQMVVGTPQFYDEEYLAHVPSELKDIYVKAKGRFVGDMSKFYFDDPKIYYSELPLAPGEKNPPPPDPFEGMISKDVYLKKNGQIVGLHAIGYPGPHEYQVVELDGTVTKKTVDFMQMEIWGNEYDDEHNMLGRGSFRVFSPLEEAAKEFEADGWVRFEGPKKRETQAT